MTTKSETRFKNGAVLYFPLNKLKKSPKNVRKTPHNAADVEALAASIAAKGLLQNLVVEPERDGRGGKTGCYLVTIGEGRRLAQLLRAKRKEIKKTEPIRCVLDTEHDPHEISLAENVIRTNMHPADQFEAFRQLADERNMSAADIAARFGVTPQVVRQRLRLGAASPKLMQVYRDGGLTLEQLTAFSLTDDHACQEEVFENLTYNKDASIIRRMLTEKHVSGRDRRARFVGADAYGEAGGVIVRDLFAEDHGGYFEDAALLDRLAMEKLQTVADDVLKEGWKWTQAHIDFPHAHGMRRIYAHGVPLLPEDQERLDAVQAEFDALSAQYENAEELPDDVDAQFGELEAEIERLSEQQYAFDPDVMAHSGVFVVLNHDGTVRIERGFVRPEDEKTSELEPIGDDARGITGAAAVSGAAGSVEGTEDGEDEKPISDLLVRDLTAHRTLALRVALGENPDAALIALTHALAAQTFYPGGGEFTCLDIKIGSQALASHAIGIEDTATAKALAERNEAWARQMPDDANGLWPFIAGLDHDSRMALLAHCAALSVFAVLVPRDKAPQAKIATDAIARVVNLDMRMHWTPTVQSYLGSVSKARILEAVREAISDDATKPLVAMKKKQAMAEAAERLLVGTGWLPGLLRAPVLAQKAHDAHPQDNSLCEVAAE